MVTPLGRPARRAGPRTALLLAAGLTLSLGLWIPGSAPATSLRFFGNGEGDIDRVKIRIDGPERPADVGASDFTLEWWMRALPGDNPSDAAGCDTNDGWITGHILFDRDVYGPGDHGDFGVSLTGGRVAFGVGFGSSGNTICGATDVADGAWHHVAVTRRRADGRLRLYVDGVLDAEGPGNVGADRNVSYRDGRATAYPGSDPFLVIGAEKHDAGPLYPSYSGWIDEVRLSTVQRYTGATFTRPAGPFAVDGSTAALYHFAEGAGDAVADAAGSSHGTRMHGGSPAGPAWSSDAAPLDPGRRVTLEQVVSSLTRPVAIAHAGDDRLFVVEADGRILAYEVPADGPLTPLGTFLDIRALVRCCGERGLLGLAFHPDYAANGYFFVYYTAQDGDGDVVVARYQRSADPDLADPASARVLLTIEHSAHANHNGGGLAFGPDGYLYVAVGDGGGAGDPLGSGQSLGTLLGKVLRLDVDVPGDPPPHYQAPADNPFVGTPGAREEIWAWGLRNPWRIAFDRLTGDLFIADVGQGRREEVNLQRAGSGGGQNYGWRRMEGTACYSPSAGCQTGGLVLPVLEYGHEEGCSVTGGYRYRGRALPALHGVYVFGDFCAGTIWGGVESGGGAWSRIELLGTSLNISSFGEDRWGELYVADLNGAVRRLARVRPRLTVARAGGGTGAVSGPGGLACGAVCAVEYEPGETIVLTATAGASAWFAGWSGACGGSGECILVMDGDRAVTATFTPRPLLQFSAPTYTASEDTGNATITVLRTGTTAGTASVDYAILGGTATAPPAGDADFAGPGGALTGTLTFPPGQASRTFTIPIVNDARAEGPETVLLSLHNPGPGAALGAQSTAVLTIVNHDAGGVFAFAQPAYSVSEGSPGAQLTVLRSQGAAHATVTWAVVPAGTTAVLGEDYLPPGGVPTGTLVFGPGVGSQAIPLTLLRQGDTRADGPRTIRLALSDAQPAAFAAVGTPAATTLVVADDDSGGLLQFSPVALTVSEGAAAGKAVLTVTRQHQASGVTVDWAVTGGTAVHGTDYGGPTSGTLAFGAGVLSRTIELPLLDPAGAQGSRTVRVALDNAGGGAALGPARSATVTITDDEVGVRFAQATYAVAEGAAAATIAVARTGPTDTAVTVRYATGHAADTASPALSPAACSAGADYRPVVAGTLTFNPGETSRSFSVPLCEDHADEGPETLTLRLTGVDAPAHLGAPSTAVLTIQENDEGGVVRLGAAAYARSEGAGDVLLTVIRSGGSAGSVLVPYVIAGGSATAPPGPGADFTGPAGGPLTGTLEFGPGVRRRTLAVPLVDDGAIEPDETLTVTLEPPLGGATLGSPAAATVTIVDDDRVGTVQFGSGAATVAESAAAATLIVTRTGSASSAAAVDYAITGDTAAVSGATTGTISFAAGQATRPLVIPLADDLALDGDSTLVVTLGPPLTGGLALGTPNPATVTLVDDEGSVQFLGPAFAAGEGSRSATITVTRTGGLGRAVTVGYATGAPEDTATAAPTAAACAPGADYRPLPAGSLTFAAGQASQTFTVPLCEDRVDEGAETLTLRLTGVSAPAQLGAPSTATLTIQENDAGGVLAFSGPAYAAAEGAPAATLTVRRTGGAADLVTVPWSVTGGTAVHGTDYGGPTGGTLRFERGRSTASLTIPLLNDAIADGARTLLLALGAPTGGGILGSPSAATLSLGDDEPSVRFSRAAYLVSETSPSAVLTVQRLGSASSTVDVTVETTAGGSAAGAAGCGAGADFQASSVGLSFLPGETTKSVVLTLCPDRVAEGTETIGLALVDPAGATLGTPHTATVTITEDDVAGTLQFAAAATSVSEAGGTARVRVERLEGSAAQVTVAWAIAGGHAQAGADFTGATSGTLTFGPDEPSQDIVIPIVARPGTQGPRALELQLDGPGGGAALGALRRATLWILDAD